MVWSVWSMSQVFKLLQLYCHDVTDIIEIMWPCPSIVQAVWLTVNQFISSSSLTKIPPLKEASINKRFLWQRDYFTIKKILYQEEILVLMKYIFSFYHNLPLQDLSAVQGCVDTVLARSFCLWGNSDTESMKILPKLTCRMYYYQCTL